MFAFPLCNSCGERHDVRIFHLRALPKKRLLRASCSRCGRQQEVRKDGTIYPHMLPIPGKRPCDGSGEVALGGTDQ